MHYDDMVAAFFVARPEGTAESEAVRAGGPARRLRDAAEPLATHPIWSRRVNEALAEHGLDFLTAYVWGRAAALGDPSPGVAAAVFGWFEPTMVGGLVEAARSAVSRETLLEVRDRETEASLAEALVGEDVGSTADLLLDAVRWIPTAGRPLFTGLLDRPVPPGAAGRLQRACDLLREARGDAHVAVVVAAGLSPVEANVVNELWHGMALGSYTGTRGWSEAAVADAVRTLQGRGWLSGEVLTEPGRAGRRELEAATDRAQQPLVDALGNRLDEIVGALDRWSARCTAAAAFPPDDLKRAAG